MSKSKASARNSKCDRPKKPYPDFPLFPHANGSWAKKIRGKLHHFGPWRDSDAALQRYLDQRDDLHAGRIPRTRAGDGVVIRDVVNHFLAAKEGQMNAGELTRRTFCDYMATCARIVAAFGRTRLVDDLAAEDFQQVRTSIAKQWGPTALGNEVQRVRSVFKYAYDAALIDKPMRFGPTFKKPNKRILRQRRQAAGPKMFERHEVKAMFKDTSLQLQCMILLGVNCGFGNHDCSSLPIKAIELAGRWVNFPRPKTAVERRCPLWPETVKALRAVIAARPEPKDEVDKGIVFITKYRQRWGKDGTANPISAEMKKLLKQLGIHRRGLGFYGLRHTFRTVSDETRDFPAIDLIMGHARDDMASVYRERISDERLRAVVDYVHKWLFGE